MKEETKIYIFDIDGTICTLTGVEYLKAEPFEDRIKKINKLYDEGNTILFHTARGFGTHKNWVSQTREQLNKWGVKYHQLYMNKPYGNYYIGDEVITIKEFFKNE
jgi:hypothetical protein